jgi:hypothetical protein
MDAHASFAPLKRLDNEGQRSEMTQISKILNFPQLTCTLRRSALNTNHLATALQC